MERELSEDEQIERNPNLDVAFYIHHLHTVDDDEIAAKLSEIIKKDAMFPLFVKLSLAFVWLTYDDYTSDIMQLTNFADNEILNKAIENAKDDYIKVTNLTIELGEFYSKIGEMGEAVELLTSVLCTHPLLTWKHISQATYHIIRIGMFELDYDLMLKYLTHIKQIYLLEYPGYCWEEQNRINVYEAVYSICVRDFKLACNLLVELIDTFSCYEIMTYSRMIRYTVYLAVLIYPREKLKLKIIDNYNVQEMLCSDLETKTYLHSLYNCNYAEFFEYLGKVEENMRKDHFFHRHYQYYVREMKVIGYKQLMKSYKSLTLTLVADKFGVTVEFIQKDFVSYITSGHLHCKINKMNETIEMNRSDERSQLYEKIIKEGDKVLQKLQKLCKVLEY